MAGAAKVSSRSATGRTVVKDVEVLFVGSMSNWAAVTVAVFATVPPMAGRTVRVTMDSLPAARFASSHVTRPEEWMSGRRV